MNHYWTESFHPKLKVQSSCHKISNNNNKKIPYSYWFDVNDILSQEQIMYKIIDVTQ